MRRQYALAVVAALASACGRIGFDSPGELAADAPDAGPGGAGDSTDPDVPMLTSDVVMNEVMAGGTEVGTDPPNIQYDWVELKNVGATDIDVSGWHLSDNAANPTKGTFPSGSVVPAGGYLQVRMREGGTPAFDFGLPKDGSQPVIFAAPNGATADQTMFPDGGAGPGGSWSRLPDGTGSFSATSTASPNLANG